MKIERRKTRQIHVGRVAVGGGAPISVQTMTKTDTRDVAGTLAQIRGAEALGCDIVRIAVRDEEATEAFGRICGEVDIPLIADIHFQHTLAISAMRHGADGIRINPGNIGGMDKVKEVVDVAREEGVSIRIGVNSGSLESDLLEKYGATPEALVESAVRHVEAMEDMGFREIKISVKASDVARTVDAYRLLSKRTDYPLHMGVTEAGTFLTGTVRSATAMGILLSEGIGDTIRVSLTDEPAREVRVGVEILRALGLRAPGASVVSCPTCGRVEVDVRRIAEEVEERLEKYYLCKPGAQCPLVAVMGCMVNGPGEAREADIAIAGGAGKFALYERGRHLATVPENEAVDVLMERVRIWCSGQDEPGSGGGPK